MIDNDSISLVIKRHHVVKEGDRPIPQWLDIHNQWTDDASKAYLYSSAMPPYTHLYDLTGIETGSYDLGAIYLRTKYREIEMQERDFW